MKEADSRLAIGRAHETDDLQARVERLLRQYPAFEPGVTLLARCGEHLAEVLTGGCEPLELLCFDDDFAVWEALYRAFPGCRFYSTLIAEAVCAALEELPRDRTVRILEVGAGTGGTASRILPRLPARQIEYLFTDLSKIFTSRARRTLGDYPFVEYGLLNIEQDPVSQGYLPQRFDLIVAAEVLHATADLRQSLGHVQQLLAPNGWLILKEPVQPNPCFDLVFGLTDGWWKFADSDLRSDYPLLSLSGWLALLKQVGFTEAVEIPVEEEWGSAEYVILARGPRAAQESPPAQSLPLSAHAGRIGSRARPLASLCGMDPCVEVSSQLDELSVAYALRALQKLGWDQRQHEGMPAGALMDLLGIVPHYQRLLQRLLALLGYADMGKASRSSQGG